MSLPCSSNVHPAPGFRSPPSGLAMPGWGLASSPQPNGCEWLVVPTLGTGSAGYSQTPLGQLRSETLSIYIYIFFYFLNR